MIEEIETVNDAPIGRIVKSAVRIGDKTYTGWRHFDIIHYLERHNIVKCVSQEDQGFITENGRFLMRSQAKSYAANVGQISEDHKGFLLSEHLWDNDGNPISE